MASMLRTRRSFGSKSPESISYECSSLPSFCDYGEAGTTDSYPLQEVEYSSSSFHEEEIPTENFDFKPEYLNRKSICLSWRAVLLRTIVVAVIFGLVSQHLKQKYTPKEDTFDFQATATTSASMPTRNVAPSPPQHKAKQPVLSRENDFQAEKKIQLMSKAKFLEKFGKGPHLVEFELNVWDIQDNKPKQHYFTVELAPVDLMPVTTYYFLQQVAEGLWSGTSFHINAEHAIAARPISGNGQVSKENDFLQSEHGTLPFTEFSSQFPHDPYTLGFVRAKKDTPSAFYINKKHNVHHHENEACFAKVVIGRSTIDLLASLKGYDHDPTRIRPVEIVAARKVSIQNLNEKAAKEYLTVKSTR